MSSTPTAETVCLPAILLLALVRDTLASTPELNVRSHDSQGYRAMSDFLRSGFAGRAAGLGYLAHVVDVVIEGGWLGSLEQCVYYAGFLRWTSSAFLQHCCGLGLRASLAWMLGDRSDGSGCDPGYVLNGAREMRVVLVARREDYEGCWGFGR
jgi:hypothetical protein